MNKTSKVTIILPLISKITLYPSNLINRSKINITIVDQFIVKIKEWGSSQVHKRQETFDHHYRKPLSKRL